MSETTQGQFGKLAAEWCGKRLPLQVCERRAGSYIGTLNQDGTPCSRESVEYWPKRGYADKALTTGWFTQKQEP